VTESERSVAVGSAAPAHAPDGEATAVLADRTDATAWDPAAHEPTAATAFDPATALDRGAHERSAGRERPAAHERPGAHERSAAHEPSMAHEPPGGATPAGERHVIRRRRWPARAIVGIGGFAGLVAIGLIAGLLFGDPGSAARTGPLSEDEVRDVAHSFAAAYAEEDPAALRATLARNVVRTLPGGTSRGRDKVVEQYERQFDGKVGGYELDDLEVQGGSAGRASGTYHVERDEGDPYDGRIVFGVVRERGQAKIALIAATPAS